MLACTQVWPSASLPSAARQASLALVPVPQGERSSAGAHHEVAAVGVGVVGKQLDVVDGRAVLAGNALRLQGVEHGPGVRGQGLAVIQFNALAVFGNQEEPVATPGDVAMHAMPGTSTATCWR